LVVIAVDVTNKEQVTEAFETTKKAFGRLDIVLNNAGFGLFCEAEGTPEAEAREQMEVGYWAPINISLQVCFQSPRSLHL
jgi:NAD(P)-dependent dehydrogenase (short-subunit alcohol dehydrogenase family)